MEQTQQNTEQENIECIQNNIEYIQKNINSAIKEVNKKLQGYCSAILRITTMTLLVRNAIGNINLCKFIDWCDKNKQCLKGLVMKSSAGFYNCVIFKNNNVSIKMFQNGNIHITGVKSIGEGYNNCITLSEIIHIYTLTNGKNKIIKASPQIEIQLINGCLKMDIGDDQILCLRSMYKLLYKEFPDLIVIFDNEHHPGLRVKFPFKEKMPTIIIFKSGSILINAFRKGSDLLTVNCVLFEWIQNNYKGCLREKYVIETKKKKQKLVFDYSTLADL